MKENEINIFSPDNPDLLSSERDLFNAFDKLKGMKNWQAKVEKEEEDGVLLVAYGGKDPKTGPMVKVRPHTNNKGDRIVGVDVCFVDRGNHQKDFDVFVGAEEFWPLCNGIVNGEFFRTLEREAAEAAKGGKMASPQRYSYKAGKKDEQGKGGGALQAGFCLSKFPGFICIHGYNAKTTAAFNLPASVGNLQMMAAMFNCLFDISESAKLRFQNALKNRKEHSKGDNEPDVEEGVSAIPEPDPQPASIELKGTVANGNPASTDKDGLHYFLASLPDGKECVVKLQKQLNFKIGQTFTIKGRYTSTCTVKGQTLQVFMAD